MTGPIEDRVNSRLRSSALRITDVRVANLAGVPFRSSVIRVDTNQGLTGYGEVRDGASKTYALLLKHRLVGENPCDVERLFRRIKQFGFHGRQGGGVSGIEIALMDLAGKAYDVPVYALLGGKYRERVLCYADTTSCPDAGQMGDRLLERKAQGYKWLKMDVGIDLVRSVPGALASPPGAFADQQKMHPFTGTQVTAKGVELLADYVAKVRDAVGYETPLSIDHFGHIGLDSCIRLARALVPFSPAWLEDMIPWQLTEQWVRLTNSVALPTCTGEDIYLKEGFLPLLASRAVSIVHPDLLTAGGIAETKRVGDLAEEHGISMALHLAASPIATLAAVHVAAATDNFLALEHHAVDVAHWDELITGAARPLISDGFIEVPDGPGLGFDGIDEQVFRHFLDPEDPSYFEETSSWDGGRSNDRLWS